MFDVRNEVVDNTHLKFLDNIHQGKRVVLFMPGHSLNEFRFVSEFDDCFYVGLNTCIFSKVLKDVTLNYYFIQDPGRQSHKFEYKNHQTAIDKYKPLNGKFYCIFPSFNFHGSGAIPFLAYSGVIKHDNGSKYEDFDDMRNNPFAKDCSEDWPYTNAGVAYTVMQFLLYMGFTTIYLVGSDITGCYFYEDNETLSNWNTDIIRLKERWLYFKEWKDDAYPDVEIITVNPSETSKGIFSDYYIPSENNSSIKNKSKLHLVSIPYSITNKEYSCCAFTQNIIKFINMMGDDYEMLHYGHSFSDISCENVIVTDEKDFEDSFGKNWESYFKKDFFKYGSSEYNKLPIYKIFEDNVTKELKNKLSRGDKILFWWGSGHIHIYENFVKDKEKYHLIEPAIGYPSVLEKTFKVYASYTAMAQHLGQKQTHWVDWGDRVIPHYFDMTEFEFSEKPEDYFVFFHRVTYAKGFDLVLNLAREMGFNLKVAGQGGSQYDLPDNVEYLGSVGIEERKILLSKAKGMLMPTMFLEPFGMSGIESMLSGTPVISTDYGAFAEWNLHGLTGYRCKRYDEFAWAISNIDNINRNFCREWAENKFSFDAIRPKYIDFFEYVDDGFHKMREIENLDNDLFFGNMDMQMEVL